MGQARQGLGASWLRQLLFTRRVLIQRKVSHLRLLGLDNGSRQDSVRASDFMNGHLLVRYSRSFLIG